LRPSPHDSEIDFVLSKYLKLDGKAPWVIDPALARRIVDAVKEDNLALMRMLDPESAESMRLDSRWWDADAFSDRAVEPWQPMAPNPEELEQLCAGLMAALHSIAAHKTTG
jgi:hypothetical protein